MYEIHLKNERPFKEPYHCIYPAVFQEVRDTRGRNNETSKKPLQFQCCDRSEKGWSYSALHLLQKTEPAHSKFFFFFHSSAKPVDCGTIRSYRNSRYTWLLVNDMSVPSAFMGVIGCLPAFANAPASFQMLMERWVGEMNLGNCLKYLDDILIFSSTFEENVDQLQAVFERLQENKLKLSPNVSYFATESVGLRQSKSAQCRSYQRMCGASLALQDTITSLSMLLRGVLDH